MKIKITGADFSACGIGQITELNAKTTALIATMGRTLSISEKLALDTFLGAIGYHANNGIYAKTKLMYLPLLSTTLANAFYDLVTSAKKYPGAYTESNIATSDYMFNGTAFGLYGNPSAVNPYKVGAFTFDNYSNNLFLCSYTKAPAQYKHFLMGKSTPKFTGAEFSNYNDASNNMQIAIGSSVSASKKLVLANINALTSNGVSFYLDGVKTNPDANTIVGTPSPVLLSSIYFGSQATSFGYIDFKPTQLIMFGTALTTDEISVLNTAILSLMSVFN